MLLMQFIQARLLNKLQQRVEPRPTLPNVAVDRAKLSRRKLFVGIVIHVQGQHNLPLAIHTLRSTARFSRGLNCGQEERDEDADNCYHYQQFHQRKA